MDENKPTENPVQEKKAPSGQLSRRWPWILGAVLLVLAAIGILTHHRSGQEMPRGRFGAGQATLISTVTAQKGDMGQYVEALGTVTPVYTVSVEARVAGEITKVSYREGQEVQIGDPLIDIDPRPYQAAVDQYRGQLDHDEGVLKEARMDMDRYREALSSNAIPQQEYADQIAVVHQDEGTVEMDQGNLSNAAVNLDYCHIASPINGRVGLRLVDPGNIVQANGTTPLVVVAQVRPITVIFTVAEDDLPGILAALHQLHKQQHLVMDIYDREDQTKIATGKLDTLDNQINTATGTLRLRGICSNEDESLFPNQFVNVHLLTNTLEGVTLIPNSAIQRNSESAYVYLLKPPANGQTNQTVQIQTVTVGATDGTNSVVNELSPGAVIAADNFNRLTDGAKVTLRPSSTEGREQGQQAQGQARHHQQTQQ